MTNEHGIERCPHQHADDGNPDLYGGPGGSLPISNAQHVRHGFEEGPAVLSAHCSILEKETPSDNTLAMLTHCKP